MLVFVVCGVRHNLYVFSLYRNPEQDGWIFYFLLASMAAMQTEDTQLKIKAVATVDCGSIMCCHIGAIRHRHG